MQKLNELKEALAKEKGYRTWTECINDHPNCMVETLMDIIALRLCSAVGQSEQLPCDRCKKLEFIIDNGLGYEDMQNDI